MMPRLLIYSTYYSKGPLKSLYLIENFKPRSHARMLATCRLLEYLVTGIFH